MVPFQNMKVDFSKKIIHDYSGLSRKVVQDHLFNQQETLFFGNQFVCFCDGYIRQVIDDFFDEEQPAKPPETYS